LQEILALSFRKKKKKKKKKKKTLAMVNLKRLNLSDG
jgi:hypothetical protein